MYVWIFLEINYLLNYLLTKYVCVSVKLNDDVSADAAATDAA